MWEAIVKIVNDLPDWYVMMLIPFIVVLGIWVFTHIRRDKQGKIIWFSQKYEDNKSQRKLDNITKDMEHTQTDLLRLQLLQYFDHRPGETETICHLYAVYKKRPEANGYIDRRFDEWQKKQVKGSE